MRLTIENLTKKYGNFVALDNVSCELEQGIYAILGLNGAGKSTLIHLITDTINRTDGRIIYDGVEILELGSKFRAILGYMPQEQAYIGEFSVLSYLYYMAELKGVSKKQAQKVIVELLDEFGLSNVAHKRMNRLSGGMRQRAILCQALLSNPKLLILDEPTAGLDIKERMNFKSFIKGISKDKIIIYCTHILSDVEDIADKVILMKMGKIVKMGTIESLYKEFINRDGGRTINELEKSFLKYL